MSKTSDKRAKVKSDHAEFLWTRVQLTAASMQAAHDDAIKVWEQHKDNLTDDQNAEVQSQVDIRQEQIKNYLMAGKDEYMARVAVNV